MIGRGDDNVDKSPYNKNKIVYGDVSASIRGYDERIFIAPNGGVVTTAKGDDKIFVSLSDDQITTGSGSDQILINSTTIGVNIVTDFADGQDKVVIDPSTGITSFRALSISGDTISFGGGNTLKLSGMSGRIDSGDFQFTAVPDR